MKHGREAFEGASNSIVEVGQSDEAEDHQDIIDIHRMRRDS